MSFEKLLNKLCTVQVKTETQGSTGSVSESWTNTYTNVMCRYNRVIQGKGSVVSGAYQVTLEDYTFYFKPDQVISKANRIVVDGLTFEVEHVFKDSAGHHLEVFARLKSYD